MLRKKKPSSFEVQLLRDGGWVLEILADDEDAARSSAGRLLLLPTTPGVRIVRNSRRPDGNGVSMVIFEQLKTTSTVTHIRVADGTGAPVCESLEDFYGLSSRLAIRRLIADYLDQKILTVSEVLYNAHELDRLLAVTPLVNSAMVSAAAGHARLTGRDPPAVRNALSKRVDEIAARARAARPTYQRNFKTRQPYMPLVERFGLEANGKRKPEDARFQVLHAAAQELSPLRDWPGKLNRLTDWLHEPVDLWARDLLDGLIADLFAASGAVRQIFGADVDPSQRLARLFDIVHGAGDSPLFAGLPDWVRALARQFEGNRLPQARQSALVQIQQQLGDTKQVGRDLRAASFITLMDRLVTTDGVIGDGDMAEALTARYARTLECGGVAGLKEAMARLIALTPEPGRKIQYLQALARSSLAERQPGLMLEALDEMAGRPRLIGSFVDSGVHPAQKMKVLSNTHALISVAQLPSEVRRKLSDLIERVFAEFLTENRILDKLDNPELPLRARVTQLARLCTSGLLVSGQPMSMVRNRLLALVDQDDFDTLVVGDLTDPAEQARELAVVQALLAAVPPAEPPALRSGEYGAATLAVDGDGATRVLGNPTRMYGGMGLSGLAGGEGSPNESALCPNCFAAGFTVDKCPVCGFRHVATFRDALVLPSGTKLSGRYRVGRLLGMGGFGITYIGRDERLHAMVAIKEYFPSAFAARAPKSVLVAASGPEHGVPYRIGLEKFLEEARLLAQFRATPEIVDVLDFFTENGTAYLVMEYLRGRSLHELLAERGGRMPFNEALAITLPIMRGLARVHERNILHRDISPDNIYITTDRQAKLLDFGAARQAIGQEDQNFTVILKRGYAPLEQYNAGGRQGPWTDIYALCATLYRAITGQMPADALSRLETDELIPPTRLGAVLPAPAEAVLLKGLAVRSQDRPRDMIELLGGFEAALAEMARSSGRE
jgi:hypothetical protein